MKKKKVNPRKQPVSKSDIERAKTDSLALALAIFLTVMKDKFDFNQEQMQIARSGFYKLASEINEGRITFKDLITVLWEEYGTEILDNGKYVY